MFWKSIFSFALLSVMICLPIKHNPSPIGPPLPHDLPTATATDSAALLQKNTSQTPVYSTIRFSGSPAGAEYSLSLDNRFPSGTQTVMARIVYSNIRPDDIWRADWSYEGKSLKTEQGNWDDASHGNLVFSYSDEAGLDTGTYTLTFAVGNRIIRRDNFWVMKNNFNLVEPTAKKTPKPKDMVDKDLIPAWELLNESESETIHHLAQLVLTRRIYIKLSDDLEAMASYRYTCSDPPKVGKVLVNEEYYEDLSWAELAGTIAHELTHAVWHLDEGVCGCTKEKEFYAAVSEITVYNEYGGTDLVEENYPGVFDDDGDFSLDLLWDFIDELYEECPDS